ncbi:t-SNARE [Microstroma glucosiphilum]|uniref:t-SNARE n=1 Tax=Pseudomicrostroma glucosiphilum TaxID=1684307 RepID=A0A316U429_9BASI|nr:t-SNARE [Pseudomicrostroma glucosiphilum]PWN19568.1 t-SNARE [Pseudomicrostroma glucosiphilum]
MTDSATATTAAAAAAAARAGGSERLSCDIKDRTSEFRSYLSHHLASQSTNSGGASTSAPKTRPPPATKGEFAKRAAAIGKDISDTTVKLGRLAELAKKKSLFDDRPVEISELTYIIKHDLAAINRQLADLQAHSKSGKAGQGKDNKKGKDRAEEHRGNVVTLLQSNLANATTAFQDVLEVRTQNMKASRDRSEQFAYGGASSGMAPGEQSVLRSRLPPAPSSRPDSPLYNPGRTRPPQAAAARDQIGGSTLNVDDGYDPKRKTKAGGYQALPPGEGSGEAGGGGNDDFLALNMGGGQQDQFMQMQLQENGDSAYMQQRSTAIESIESTISELGQIFSQLAHMVAEQRETVQRIDDNIMDVADNVSGAQRELLKYYNSVASNRWLMFKIFGVLIVFFLLFILVS